MAAAAATSPSLTASRVIVPSHFGARRWSWRRDTPSLVAATTSFSFRLTPSLQLRFSPPPRFTSVVSYARRGKNTSAAARSGALKEKKPQHADEAEEDDIDEDAFEALFSLLEEDLKNDNMSDDDIDDEITEEDLARLEEELADALGDEEEDSFAGDMPSDLESLNDSDEDKEDYKPPKLKNWQLRRLASALKNGRRKTSIKNLSAELGLDRAVVLDLLRDPPPNLLLMAASLPDKLAESLPETQEKSTPVECLPGQADVTDTKSEEEMPVHVMKTRWSNKKRLKKVQVDTLERVYARTKRPTDSFICEKAGRIRIIERTPKWSLTKWLSWQKTPPMLFYAKKNAMISSIVHVTNLPWKTVVKWFEDKRVQDGVPELRLPFRRSENEAVSSR